MFDSFTLDPETPSIQVLLWGRKSTNKEYPTFLRVSVYGHEALPGCFKTAAKGQNLERNETPKRSCIVECRVSILGITTMICVVLPHIVISVLKILWDKQVKHTSTQRPMSPRRLETSHFLGQPYGV